MDRDKLYEAVSLLKEGQVIQDEGDTLTFLIPSEEEFVKVSLFVLQRAEAKDYRDIVALLQDGQSLERGLGAARALYGTQFQPSESLKALTFFEDGDLPTLTKDERSILTRASAAVSNI